MEFYEFLARVVSYIPAQYAGVAATVQALVPALALVFMILTCFLGYRLHRVWIAVSFTCIGLWCGALLGTLFPNVSITVFLWIGLAVAVGMIILSFKLYRVGLFCYNAWLVFSLVYDLTAPLLPPWAYTLLALALGVIAGILALRYRQAVTVSTTCISGAFTAAPMLLRLTGGANTPLLYTLAVLLAIAGAAVQLSLEGHLFGRRRRR